MTASKAPLPATARIIADLEGTADVLDHHIRGRYLPYSNLDRPTYLSSL